MITHNHFRFGVVVPVGSSRTEVVELTQKIEDLGYDILLLPDHFDQGVLSPSIALMLIAASSSRLRIGTFVYNNDFRHPAVLAKDVATLDLLSEGRFELGIGAGYLPEDYKQTGILFDKTGIRMQRMKETVQIIKHFFTEETVSFNGKYYNFQNLKALPKGIQKPYPPIYIGGGGQRVLSYAAQEASIVGLTALAKPDGSFDFSSINEEASMQKIAWIREAAGDRFDTLEINSFVFIVNITDHREQVAQGIAEHIGLTGQDLLTTPHCLIGTVAQICEDISKRQEQYGISYLTIPFEHVDTFAPIIAHFK